MLGIFLRALHWARQRLNLVAYLTAENLVLRQQLLVLKRGQKRPQIKKRDRLFWVATSRVWSGWRDALVIVKPDTVVRWHRKGFRLYWRRKVPGRKARSTTAGPCCEGLGLQDGRC